PEQQEAVQATDGPVLIIAGPGSGKTRTLTHRIAYLLARGKARPDQILALTFTNRAAREMRERIVRLVGPDGAAGMWMGTFHATFARLLRREAQHLGFTSDFSIYDTDDTDRILRSLMPQYNIDPRQFSTNAMRSLISGAKNGLVGPSEYARLATSPAQEKAAQLYGPYVETLRTSNALDFDDLLVKPIELFRKNPAVLARYQHRWRYLHIDEYQDTNHAQYTLARLLAAAHKNICVVGDDAQSIYAFRGADIGNILSFQKDYPNATTVRLERNYRSSGHILAVAQAVIRNNQEQLEKELWTERPSGEHVVLMEALSEKDEAQKVERRVRDLHVRRGYQFRDFAVLYRTNAQSRSLEEALRRGGIPYRVVGGVSFYQRKEIKDVLAYLRLAVNPHDSASIRRVINYPVRGIGNKTQEEINDFARVHDIGLWDALQRLDEVGLSARAGNAVAGFRDLIARYHALVEERPAADLARDLVQETGILQEFRQENTQESLVRWENVQELFNAIAEYGRTSSQATLSMFLQEISLLTDEDASDDDPNRVTLMTLHASKGLEFPVVFVTGLEEGLFPLAAALDDRRDLEEERRLFYVGVTRAKDQLFMSYARTRFRYGEHFASVRSRFVDEIQIDAVRTETGDAVETRPDRFRLPAGQTIGYEEMDPHYYRDSLRGEGGLRSRSSIARSTSPRSEPGERRIVYDEDESAIVPGVRVEHEQFGEGKVLSVEGAGENAKAVVFFAGVGQKKLVLKFARLRCVG
ncbi:MAG TPA: UvrD-helicase domain-containing protein, partial [Rhodothermales bacterium]